MSIEEALAGVRSILLDTAPVIYHVERHPRYGPLMASLLAIRSQRGILAVTSPVTVAECLVVPFRLGRADLANSYAATLLNGEDIEFHDLDAQLAIAAAQVRAELNLALLDAFQVAVARQAGCEAILTNDTLFKRVGTPRAIILDELLGDDA